MIDLLDYADLPVGGTRQGDCPTCGKRKFYVTRKPAGYAYICFRASCPTQGFAGSTALDCRSFSRSQKPQWSRQYTGELHLPGERDLQYFADWFGVDDHLHDGYWLKVTDDDRYAFPLWGVQDEYRGIVLRRPTWQDCPRPDRKAHAERGNGDYPKTLNYFEDNAAARCGWYHSGDEMTVVLVEDCISAMRIACEGFTAIALLGTHFMPEHLRDIQRWHKGARYIIALDPDATNKALELARKWGPAFPGPVSVACLVADPKDYIDSSDLLEDLGL